jgi:hypothetical protein
MRVEEDESDCRCQYVDCKGYGGKIKARITGFMEWKKKVGEYGNVNDFPLICSLMNDEERIRTVIGKNVKETLGILLQVMRYRTCICQGDLGLLTRVN